MVLSLNFAIYSPPGLGQVPDLSGACSSISQGEFPHLLCLPQLCPSECLLQPSWLSPHAHIFAFPSFKFILGSTLSLKKNSSPPSTFHRRLATHYMPGAEEPELQDTAAPKELTTQWRRQRYKQRCTCQRSKKPV